MKKLLSTVAIMASLSLPAFADDTAAAAGGVPVGGLYRIANVVQVRLV